MTYKPVARVLPKPRAIEPEALVDEKDERDDDKKRQTLYMPIPVHDQIREAAFVKRISQQEVFRQALNLWFEQEGLPSWGELAPKKERGEK